MMSKTGSGLIQLRDASSNPIESVGNKAYNLSIILTEARVPPGFVVPPDIELDETVLASAVSDIKWPVSARSSAPYEDTEKKSYAGQFLTVMDIDNSGDLVKAVQRVRTSGRDEEPIPVLVQHMVKGKLSGVIFTRNPIGKGILIEVVEGMGEGLVSGKVKPERYVLNGRKTEGKLLTSNMINKLNAAGLKIQNILGSPQDIEFTVRGKDIYIVQSRPITTDYRDFDLEGCEWTASPLNERITEPLSTWELSIMEETIPQAVHAMEPFGFEVPGDMKILKVFNGRPYINLTLLKRMFSHTPELVDVVIQTGARLDTVKLRGRSSKWIIPIVLRFPSVLRSTKKDWSRIRNRIDSETKALEGVDFSKLSDEDLIEIMDRGSEIIRKAARPHFVSVALAELMHALLVIWLSACYALRTGAWTQSLKRFGRSRTIQIYDRAEREANRLLTDIRSQSYQENRELASLAEMVKNDPDLTHLFQKYSGQELYHELGEREEAVEFIAHFNHFLREHGHRDPIHSFLYPSWKERPELVLDMIRNMALFGKERKKKRESRTRIKPPLPLLPLHNYLLRWGRQYAYYRENQQFHMGKMFPLVRGLMLEIGGRLVQRGEVEERMDVFFLRPEEVKKALLRGENLGQTASDRRERWKSYRLRERPDKIPPDGMGVGALRGVGGSPGIGQGPAVMILKPDDFHKMRDGAVIVTKTTNPAWTPIFRRASALVTDIGGALSHAAIVARELGIPAVLGTGKATQDINEGDVIVVDGNKGRVWNKGPGGEDNE